MLASIPAALVLLVGAVLAALTATHIGASLSRADIGDAVDDLVITMTVDQRVQGVGGQVTWRVSVANVGPGRFQDGAVLDELPGSVMDVRWTCTAAGGARCLAAAGVGDVADDIVLPPGGSVSVEVDGAVAEAAAGGSIVNRASFRARSLEAAGERVILRSEAVTTLVPEPGHDVG